LVGRIGRLAGTLELGSSGVEVVREKRGFGLSRQVHNISFLMCMVCLKRCYMFGSAALLLREFITLSYNVTKETKFVGSPSTNMVSN
jgi:hypothetical protein